MTYGAYPKRANNNLGKKISAGWLGENEWVGFLKPEEKLFLINPEKGFISTANNKVTSINVEHRIGDELVSTA